MRTEEKERKGEQAEAGKACEKGKREREGERMRIVYPSRKKKKKWEECRKVCRRLDERGRLAGLDVEIRQIRRRKKIGK